MYDKYVKDIVDLYEKEQNEYEELEKKNLPHEKEHEEEDKITEKYDKLILDVNKKYNIIFRYDLLDTFQTQISTLIITNDEKDNVICVYDNEGYEKELENKTFTVDVSIIEKLISDYEVKLKEVKEIESPAISEGVMNNFYFDINGKVYTFEAFNMWAWEEDIPLEVQLFINIFNDLKEVLKKDVDNLDRCLTLGE